MENEISNAKDRMIADLLDRLGKAEKRIDKIKQYAEAKLSDEHRINIVAIANEKE